MLTKFFKLNPDLSFLLVVWSLSRGVILLAMWGIAPLLKVPQGSLKPEIGLKALTWWDGLWYIQVASQGYEYFNDSKEHSVAFFPLFPLGIRALMGLGLSPELAGVLINNLAFFGAMVLLYFWLKKEHNIKVAKGAVLALAWCPYSLYSMVVYTEGLFLLLTTATLWAFERGKYGQVAVWGMLATATRPPGIAMIPALLLRCWRTRRPWLAYGASLAVGGGIILFAIYCGVKFGEPLAFVKVQAAWGRSRNFDVMDWWKVLMYVAIGVRNYDAGMIKDFSQPLIFGLVSCSGFGLWYFRQKLGEISTYGGCFLIFILWLIGGDPFLTLMMVWGGLYLLWHTRHEMNPVVLLYGFCNLALILTSGRSESSERLAYGIISLAVGAGIVLAKYPRWCYPLMGLGALILATFAIRFAQQLWIA